MALDNSLEESEASISPTQYYHPYYCDVLLREMIRPSFFTLPLSPRFTLVYPRSFALGKNRTACN